MSLVFQWPAEFPADTVDEWRQAVEDVLNAAAAPAAILSPIKVHELVPGASPPELALAELKELGPSRAVLSLRLSYASTAALRISTTVNANAVGVATDAVDARALEEMGIVAGAIFSLVETRGGVG